MIETKSKKDYDELAEEILRWVKENNLYVKLEKYKWKVREIDFLGDRLFRSDNRIRKNKNRKIKGESDIGLAST